MFIFIGIKERGQICLVSTLFKRENTDLAFYFPSQTLKWGTLQMRTRVAGRTCVLVVFPSLASSGFVVHLRS